MNPDAGGSRKSPTCQVKWFVTKNRQLESTAVAINLSSTNETELTLQGLGLESQYCFHSL